jgi:hypothetical protein
MLAPVSDSLHCDQDLEQPLSKDLVSSYRCAPVSIPNHNEIKGSYSLNNRTITYDIVQDLCGINVGGKHESREKLGASITYQSLHPSD